VNILKSQFVAVCCSVLRCVVVVQWRCGCRCDIFKRRCVAVCCGVLRCVAVCCGVLRCVAVCCSGSVDAGVTFSKASALRCVAVAVWMQV